MADIIVKYTLFGNEVEYRCFDAVELFILVSENSFVTMKTYKVKLVSQTNATVFIILSLVVFISCKYKFLPNGLKNQVLSLLLVVITFTIVYFLWQLLVTAKTRWTINDEGVSMAWTKKFAFTKDEDFFVKWEMIDSVTKGPDRNYYNLEINLVSGVTLDFYHGLFTMSDQFHEFVKDLKATLKEKQSKPDPAV